LKLGASRAQPSRISEDRVNDCVIPVISFIVLSGSIKHDVNEIRIYWLLHESVSTSIGLDSYHPFCMCLS